MGCVARAVVFGATDVPRDPLLDLDSFRPARATHLWTIPPTRRRIPPHHHWHGRSSRPRQRRSWARWPTRTSERWSSIQLVQPRGPLGTVGKQVNLPTWQGPHGLNPGVLFTYEMERGRHITHRPGPPGCRGGLHSNGSPLVFKLVFMRTPG